MASQTASQPKFLNKAARAKLGKDTINILVPQILKSNERAKKGVNASHLIAYDPKAYPAVTATPPAPGTHPTNPSLRPKIRIIQSDTLDAVQSLLQTPSSTATATSTSASTPTSTFTAASAAASASAPTSQALATRAPKHRKILALNMCSALRPGGGVLSGASAQEESLCLRSTLYASLREEFYRLPETSAVYSPDVLVFRPSASASTYPEVMRKEERFWVDVVSCAAVRCSDLVRGEGGEGTSYADERDREAMVLKIRTVFQVAAKMGATHLVLGALGCGAYGNPATEVARIFKKVVCGDRKRPGVMGIEEIVFAIFDDGENLRVFRSVFGDVVAAEGIKNVEGGEGSG